MDAAQSRVKSFGTATQKSSAQARAGFSSMGTAATMMASRVGGMMGLGGIVGAASTGAAIAGVGALGIGGALAGSKFITSYFKEAAQYSPLALQHKAMLQQQHIQANVALAQKYPRTTDFMENWWEKLKLMGKHGVLQAMDWAPLGMPWEVKPQQHPLGFQKPLHMFSTAAAAGRVMQGAEYFTDPLGAFQADLDRMRSAMAAQRLVGPTASPEFFGFGPMRFVENLLRGIF